MKGRFAVAALPLALSALLAAGCVSTARPPGARPAAATPDVESRVAELERQAKMAEVELRRLRVQVAELQAELEGRSAGAGWAESSAAPRAQPIPNPPRAEVESTDLVIEDGSPGPGVVRARPPGLDESFEGSRGESPSSLPVPLDGAAQALYDRGYTLYHQERFIDAETAFQRFLQAHADTDLADNALYWIGESRFARSDLRGALAAFDEAVERFPEGNKVPDALLKAGDCLERLGDRERARANYERILQRFPASAASERARERLDRLR